MGGPGGLHRPLRLSASHPFPLSSSQPTVFILLWPKRVECAPLMTRINGTSCIHLVTTGSSRRSDTTPRPDPPGSLCQVPSIGPPQYPHPGRNRDRDSPSILYRPSDLPPSP